MNSSTHTTRFSCPVSETFDLDGATAFGGANLLMDLGHKLNLWGSFDSMDLRKAPWATYPLATDLEVLVYAKALGLERIAHMVEIERDPLLCTKLGLDKLPDTTTLYRSLERFCSQEDVNQLHAVNRPLLQRLVGALDYAILDIDTTVETVHGQQEGSTVGYNPTYHGRPSYQPFVGFEGQTGAAVAAVLRAGSSPCAQDVVAFIDKCSGQLPKGVPLAYVRGDRGMTSGRVCEHLEAKGINYTLKLKMNKTLWQRIYRGVLWYRLPNNDPATVIETASLRFKAGSWKKHRRVVLIRTRPAFEPQQMLFAEYAWRYEAIVTSLDWDSEDIWHFYNQRCTCENYIKELKAGVNIDAISKDGLWPNAADLWLKLISYNLLLILGSLAPAEYRGYSVRRLRRALLRVPGVLVRHARQWSLRLPSYWPHIAAWRHLRAVLG